MFTAQGGWLSINLQGPTNGTFRFLQYNFVTSAIKENAS